MKGDKPLENVNHEKFCQGIVKGLSAERAYIKAGYAVSTASRACASRLLTNANVKDRIAFLQGKGLSKHEAEVQELKDFCDEIMKDQEQRPSDRLKAAELKGKMLGAFTTNTRISGGDGGPIILKWKKPAEK